MVIKTTNKIYWVCKPNNYPSLLFNSKKTDFILIEPPIRKDFPSFKLMNILAANDGKEDTFKYKHSKCESCNYMIDWQFHDLKYKCNCSNINYRNIKHYDSKLVILISNKCGEYLDLPDEQGIYRPSNNFIVVDNLVRLIYERANEKNIKILEYEAFCEGREVEL
jgi:hypothetical protein